ncbi:MAG TPA: hypothetical protein VLI04_10360 [Nocardioidaceae bacterium]|nr:hypothetical protein [Nocardioidaceae bacterium]
MNKSFSTAAALSLSACLLLTACGGGDKDGTDGDATPTPTPTETLPPGVVLTEPGTELTFGETATVKFTPSRASESTYLTFTVVDATMGRLSDLKGFNLDTDYKRNANYYFVNVEVANLGEVDLGGRDVPLHAVNEADTLLPPVVFQSAFPTCPSTPLPKVFGQGATLETCLVYLAPEHGELTAMTTLTDGTVEAVTWVGEVQDPAPIKKPGKKKNKQP